MMKMKIEDGVLVSCRNACGDIIIPDSVTRIGNWAFRGCASPISISIPDSVTSIGAYAFWGCEGLTSITIPDSVTSIGDGAFWVCTELKSREANYKAFNVKKGKLFCRDYEYTPGKWSEEITEPVLCKRGYHFCTNLFSIFNYYAGGIDKDIVIYECEVGGKVISDGDKSVTNRIKPVRKLSRKEIFLLMKG